MTARRKDFQKAATLIHEFQLKLSEDAECAELRDSLNLALLHMQKYYRTLRTRLNGQDKNGTLNGTNSLLGTSFRGLSPMTPFRDTPDKFVWRWINLDSPKVSGSLPFELQTSLPLLIKAAKDADNEMITELLEEDPDKIHEIDGLGRSSVMYAVQFNNLDTLQILLEHSCDSNAVSNDGSTAAHRACHNGNDEALQILISYNADLTISDAHGRSPIHWACTHKNIKCLELLLQQGISASTRDKDGMTASMWACRMDNIEHFELLSSEPYRESVSEDEFERDNSGRTWLHWAVRRTEPLECLRTLMTEEASLLRDMDGKTPLHIAAEQGSMDSAKVIVEIAGKSCIEERESQDRTPLIIAAIGGHGELVNFLLSQGADLASVDSNGATAWDYARGRSLNYCMLIIASYIRQRSDQDDSNQEEEKENVDEMVNESAIEQLQINGDGETTKIYYGNRPVEAPHPPAEPPTPRTPRGPGSITPGRSSRPRTPGSPPKSVPKTAETHVINGTVQNLAHVPPKTPRAFGIKRSQTSPIEPVTTGDIQERNSSGGKKRRSDLNEREVTVMSLMSVDSTDIRAEAPQINGQSDPDIQQNGHEELQILEEDPNAEIDNVSIGAMDVSDVEGDGIDQGTPRNLEYEHDQDTDYNYAMPIEGDGRDMSPTTPRHIPSADKNARLNVPNSQQNTRSHELSQQANNQRPSQHGNIHTKNRPKSPLQREVVPYQQQHMNKRKSLNSAQSLQSQVQMSINATQDNENNQGYPDEPAIIKSRSPSPLPPDGMLQDTLGNSLDAKFLPPAHLEPLPPTSPKKKRKKKKKDRNLRLQQQEEITYAVEGYQVTKGYAAPVQPPNPIHNPPPPSHALQQDNRPGVPVPRPRERSPQRKPRRSNNAPPPPMDNEIVGMPAFPSQHAHDMNASQDQVSYGHGPPQQKQIPLWNSQNQVRKQSPRNSPLLQQPLQQPQPLSPGELEQRFMIENVDKKYKVNPMHDYVVHPSTPPLIPQAQPRKRTAKKLQSNDPFMNPHDADLHRSHQDAVLGHPQPDTSSVQLQPRPAPRNNSGRRDIGSNQVPHSPRYPNKQASVYAQGNLSQDKPNQRRPPFSKKPPSPRQTPSPLGEGVPPPINSARIPNGRAPPSY